MKNKMDLKQLINLFDKGPLFDSSYSPLYERIPSSTEPSFDYFLGERNVPNVNCRLLFEKDLQEIQRLDQFNKSVSNNISLCQQTEDCDKFIHNRKYVVDPLTEEEKLFSIAYSILVYDKPEQFEILLRAIYRPQNFYCIHVDSKASLELFDEFKCAIKCFPNVFLASQRIPVEWGKMSVLTPELVCLKDLLQFSRWKYFINLTGQEFPLRTNYEIVKILKILNGSNDAEGTLKRANKERWNIKEKPPHNINPVKGSIHVTLNRQFVEYVISNPVAKDFLNWVNKTDIPDETYFASLIHNPHLGIPGSFKGDIETDFAVKKPFLSRFKNWVNAPNPLPCLGKYVRSICIFGLGDLPQLARRPEFFANKFHIDYKPHVIHCMDQLIFNRTRDELYKNLKFRTTFYENIESIKDVV
ncbi:beta-1,3-galactosyl-O-glycosyl-glycoprotein beta-1,6-N-acetylglucosaminyltransferase-like [Saccostrea cucullata]|uniref:beta-1,3-galactosyl-O-glycosyl-glycoprotein beta-1,6-N-acetylglucosaminyltransferase-like n=1 Tax=Saccostrea cuccullata TaxID=36930 RepID=UPI002ED21CD7